MSHPSTFGGWRRAYASQKNSPNVFEIMKWILSPSVSSISAIIWPQQPPNNRHKQEFICKLHKLYCDCVCILLRYAIRYQFFHDCYVTVVVLRLVMIRFDRNVVCYYTNNNKPKQRWESSYYTEVIVWLKKDWWRYLLQHVCMLLENNVYVHIIVNP